MIFNSLGDFEYYKICRLVADMDHARSHVAHPHNAVSCGSLHIQTPDASVLSRIAEMNPPPPEWFEGDMESPF